MGAIYSLSDFPLILLIMLDTYCWGNLTREETIDILERRQEATVLRYMRQMPSVHENGALEDHWLVDDPFEDHHEDFSRLNNTEIASIMAGEQKKIEWRLQRQMAALRGQSRSGLDLNKSA